MLLNLRIKDEITLTLNLNMPTCIGIYYWAIPELELIVLKISLLKNPDW